MNGPDPLRRIVKGIYGLRSGHAVASASNAGGNDVEGVVEEISEGVPTWSGCATCSAQRLDDTAAERGGDGGELFCALLESPKESCERRGDEEAGDA